MVTRRKERETMSRFSRERFPVIVLCGSMRFYDTMIRIAEKLTYGGYVVLMPFASKENIEAKNEEQRQFIERRLDIMHKVKIHMAGTVLVVDTDYDKTLDTYIGASTTSEIELALNMQIPVLRYSLIDISSDGHFKL